MSASRPEFEPTTAEEVAARKRVGVLPWLRLMRLPNVFTAIADVAMGYLFVRRDPIDPLHLVQAILATSFLYTAGMVFNDVFDYEIDKRERPFRPLPSGKISRAAARQLGTSLLIAGIAVLLPQAFLAGVNLPPVLAMVLVGCILAYDAWLKHTPLGPLGMGACRFFNVLMGMSVADEARHLKLVELGSGELLAAAGIGIYVVGVTWFARSEAETSRRGHLLAAMVVMAAGVVALAASGLHVPLRIEPKMYWLLLALLTFSVLRRCFAAVVDPAPNKVQAAVKHSILSLIWLDAATAIAVSGPVAGIAIAALLIPALILGRWVYST
jgi:4-hydroxybenzoate polyprenyltransferase